MLNFILNPSSRSRSGPEVWPMIQRTLHQQSIPYEVFASRFKGHATEIARDITKKNPEETLIVVGGDGSIHEVLNGISDLSRATLGVIPLGSGNDFANGMGISKDPAKALQNILRQRKIASMDVGCVKKGKTSSRFAVSAGIGFDAAVCHMALSSSIKNSLNAVHAGSMTYSVIAARQILLYDSETVRVRLDGERSFTFPGTWFVAVMNQCCEGGGLRLCPDASATDGILDVFVGAGVTRAELVTALPLARFGLHTKYRGIHFLRCRSVDILTEQKRPIHLDGESGGTDNVLHASLEPDTLSVIL